MAATPAAGARYGGRDNPMRLFFAVPVPETVRERVAGIIRGCELDDPPWRWIKPDNYHLTLKFLGEVEDSLVKPLESAASRVAARFPPFRIDFDSFGAFPSLGKPRVLFYDISGGFKPLSELSREIDEGIEFLGFEREKRAFRAHLTLARIKKPLPSAILDRLERFPSLPPGTAAEIDSFQLMSSSLGRGGATYREVANFDLEGADSR